MHHLIKKMKQVFIILSAIFITKATVAQKKVFSFGMKAGANISKVAILPLLPNRTEQYGVGIHAGGVMQMQLIDKLILQVEPLYNLQHTLLKFNPSTNASEINLTLHQISLPVLFSYALYQGIGVNAGLSANYNLYFNQRVTMDIGGDRDFNITDEIVRFQPGITGGVSYALKRVIIDARYNRMLNNLYKKRAPGDMTEYHLGTFQLSVGCMF